MTYSVEACVEACVEVCIEACIEACAVCIEAFIEVCVDACVWISECVGLKIMHPTLSTLIHPQCDLGGHSKSICACQAGVLIQIRARNRDLGVSIHKTVSSQDHPVQQG